MPQSKEASSDTAPSKKDTYKIGDMRETQYDGQECAILQGHSLSGINAFCLGALKTSLGWALVMKLEDWPHEFCVFKKEHFKLL